MLFLNKHNGSLPFNSTWWPGFLEHANGKLPVPHHTLDTQKNQFGFPFCYKQGSSFPKGSGIDNLGFYCIVGKD